MGRQGPQKPQNPIAGRCSLPVAQSPGPRGCYRQSHQIINALQRSRRGRIGGFIEKGGILNFVLRDDRVQVQINHKAGTQAGLDISSRLWSVAKLVIE